jgi:peptidoglycan hydrolase-like amidase
MLASAGYCSAQRVRIVVAGLFHPAQLEIEASAAHPLLVAVDGTAFVVGAGARQRLTLRVSHNNVVANLAGRSAKAPRVEAAARSGADSEFTLIVPNKLHRLYRGKLSVTSDGRQLIPVVEMDIETAVASVVAAESAPGTPLEALKAQAVVSRSFLVAGGSRHVGADFCDTTHCQFLREPPTASSAAACAAAATRGLVLAWQGKPFAAMYSASCGGKTHTLAEVGLPPRDYPYFAVECAYCRRSPENWSSKLSAKDDALLRDHSESGRLKVSREHGWSTVPSNTFETEQVSGGLLLTGVGRGHGIGLCQRGAGAMAREGKSFREILTHYFPNAKVTSAN